MPPPFSDINGAARGGGGGGGGVADILDHSAKHLIPGLRVSRNSEE